MNENDLRFIKTEKLLQDTYLQLKSASSKPVKIVDLCSKAMVNKTTFYKHYETMDILHARVCRNVVSEILDRCENIDRMFTDTDAFVMDLCRVFTENHAYLSDLSAGTSLDMSIVVEQLLMERYLKGNGSADTQIEIHFAFGGALRVLAAERSDAAIQKTSCLLKKVIDSINEP